MAKEGYIGGPTGGIPERVFQRPHIEGKIFGASGKELHCSVKPKEIRILPYVDRKDNYIFSAYRDETNTLRLAIRTKSFVNPERKHPDLYAKKLLERSIEFFNNEGPELEHIKGRWSMGGDNFSMYKQYMLDIEQRRTIVEEDRKKAAKHTWTAKIAHDNGFLEVVHVDERIGFIEATFSKPQK